MKTTKNAIRIQSNINYMFRKKKSVGEIEALILSFDIVIFYIDWPKGQFTNTILLQ